MMRRLSIVWRRAPVLNDRRGIAMTEFALILPVILFLYLGGIQLQDGVACDRKVTIATRAAADLVAQSTVDTVTPDDVTASLNAALQVLMPYSADRATVRVSAIATDANGVTTVQWSKGQQIAAYARGKTLVVPAAMKKPGTNFLLSEMTYAYDPPVAFGAIGSLTLSDSLFMVPRNTDKIDCPTC